MQEEIKGIAVVGLGYVGLPLAVEFASKYQVKGYDYNTIRIGDLWEGKDKTLEISLEHLRLVLTKEFKGTSPGLMLTSNLKDIEYSKYYIITVPTPITKDCEPDPGPLFEATRTVGSLLRKGCIVIFESTVYPGMTEEECVPILEKTSCLVFNQDFYVGYSPERINPGDKVHTITKVKKITSGSTKRSAEEINLLYNSIIPAGTHMAPSIKVAEAAKVIENAQRDINIAFVNELSKIFHIMGIDTGQVLEAANTKWNFMNFTPGLVGGHCIGVDPYYLTKKAQRLGYNPEIILAGRRLNDGMGGYVADTLLHTMKSRRIEIAGARILILGVTFKENCPDIRNTRVLDIISPLAEAGGVVSVFDPWADPKEVKKVYGFDILPEIPLERNIFDVIILAVAHRQFSDIDIDLLKRENSVVFDIKRVLPQAKVDIRL